MARGGAPGLARVAFRRHRVRPVAEDVTADPADRRHLHPAGRADTAGCQRVGGNAFVLGHAARRGRMETMTVKELYALIAREFRGADPIALAVGRGAYWVMDLDGYRE